MIKYWNIWYLNTFKSICFSSLQPVIILFDFTHHLSCIELLTVYLKLHHETLWPENIIIILTYLARQVSDTKTHPNCVVGLTAVETVLRGQSSVKKACLGLKQNWNWEKRWLHWCNCNNTTLGALKGYLVLLQVWHSQQVLLQLYML